VINQLKLTKTVKNEPWCLVFVLKVIVSSAGRRFEERSDEEPTTS